MGGNGFYWVVSYSAEKPWMMEVRRGENGVRAWQAAPGETSHSTTGEKGGIWRNRGRAPQKLFGTGFTSEGYGGSFHYDRMPDGELPGDELDVRRRDAGTSRSGTSAWSAAAPPARRSTAPT